ncbi:MAG: hypothetical protein IJH04_04210 [Eggerthellaceae bacterium]|nr:hypothetical protein [Eggerthellaceae bacterium]
MNYAGAQLQDTHLIPCADFAGFHDPTEDALAREDAITCEVIDGAPRMADLPDLRDFDCGGSNFQKSSKRHTLHVYPARGDVFRKVAVSHVQSVVACHLDGFFGEERHLPMPATRMSIVDHAVVTLQLYDARFRGCFARSLALGDVHRLDDARIAFFWSGSLI